MDLPPILLEIIFAPEYVSNVLKSSEYLCVWVVMEAPNLLETGIFTVAEAAELVGVSERKIRGWIAGYPNGAAPILKNDLGWLDGHLAFSFSNLMELRFIAFFNDAGVKVREIRNIMNEARNTIAHPHPFATDIVFKTDGKKIVAEIAKNNGIQDIYDLKTKNYEMQMIVLASLKDEVIFDPNGDAMAWYPRPKIAPNVIVHPRFSFGKPILKDSRIPTRTIAEAVKVEGSQKSVAEIYEISERRVSEAVRFETKVREAA
ncbi:DUF433 domain-containing protein [Azospirillum doebereinerae]|uniref:DUF433 domain-containing protein n=1 Tax=Azospirillum doebereinerae TaxID=92933 RepID=A0A3S0WJ00_9PROT|nr:DUF433 domain-containing protein [Azospirillum doebereinerae]